MCDENLNGIVGHVRAILENIVIYFYAQVKLKS